MRLLINYILIGVALGMIVGTIAFKTITSLSIIAMIISIIVIFFCIFDLKAIYDKYQDE